MNSKPNEGKAGEDFTTKCISVVTQTHLSSRALQTALGKEMNSQISSESAEIKHNWTKDTLRPSKPACALLDKVEDIFFFV